MSKSNGPHCGQISSVWSEGRIKQRFKLGWPLRHEGWMDPIQREGDPLCVHGNCTANSLLLCCQEAAGDRTQDALRGFTAISGRYPHRCSRVAIKLQGWGRPRRESAPICRSAAKRLRVDAGGHAEVHRQRSGTRGEGLTIQGRGGNVLSASEAHWSCCQRISDPQHLHSWVMKRNNLLLQMYVDTYATITWKNTRIRVANFLDFP